MRPSLSVRTIEQNDEFEQKLFNFRNLLKNVGPFMHHDYQKSRNPLAFIQFSLSQVTAGKRRPTKAGKSKFISEVR